MLYGHHVPSGRTGLGEFSPPGKETWNTSQQEQRNVKCWSVDSAHEHDRKLSESTKRLCSSVTWNWLRFKVLLTLGFNTEVVSVEGHSPACRFHNTLSLASSLSGFINLRLLYTGLCLIPIWQQDCRTIHTTFNFYTSMKFYFTRKGNLNDDQLL